MKIETYKAQFVEFTEKAMRLSGTCKSKANLQQKITRLSGDAVEFYKTNSNCKEADYQLRIEIFLEFDNFLKSIKNDFLLQSQDKKRGLFFTTSKQIKRAHSDDSISSLDNSITL